MYRFLPATAVVLFLASLVAGDSHIFDITQGGQRAESNGFSISGGYCYARKRTPAVTLGTVQPPGGMRKFTYLVLSKFEGKRLKMPSVKCDLNVDGSEATDKCTLEAEGKKLGLVYSVRVDKDVIASEDFTVNGKKVDLQNGRVLLVDFSKDAAWTQVKAALPEHPGDPGTTDSLHDMAMDLVQQLRKDNASVRDFCK